MPKTYQGKKEFAKLLELKRRNTLSDQEAQKLNKLLAKYEESGEAKKE